MDNDNVNGHYKNLRHGFLKTDFNISKKHLTGVKLTCAVYDIVDNTSNGVHTVNCDIGTSNDAHNVTDSDNDISSDVHVVFTNCFTGDHSDIVVNDLLCDNISANTHVPESCVNISANTDLLDCSDDIFDNVCSAECCNKISSEDSEIECDDKTPDGATIIECDDNVSDKVECIDNSCKFIDDYHINNVPKSGGFKIGCLNARSLYPKLEEISRFVITNHFDIFIVNETWLDSSFTDADLEIHDYNIFRRDRSRQGGGVCIYVKTHLKCNLVSDMGISIESLWLSLYMDKEKFIVGSVYRPPSSDSLYNEHILDEIEKLKNLCDNVILLGDLNWLHPIHWVKPLFLVLLLFRVTPFFTVETSNLHRRWPMSRGTFVPKSFDLDLKLKVTELFEGQKFTFLSSMLLIVES